MHYLPLYRDPTPAPNAPTSKIPEGTGHLRPIFLQVYFKSGQCPPESFVVCYKKWKYTPAVRSNIFLLKLIFASCVCDTPIARITGCVSSLSIVSIGRRLPLQLQQCSFVYQGQQADVNQSVRGNCKTRFWGGQNLTASCGRKCIRLSRESCKSNNRWREGGVFKYVGAWLLSIGPGLGGGEGGGEGGGTGGTAQFCAWKL